MVDTYKDMEVRVEVIFGLIEAWVEVVGLHFCSSLSQSISLFNWWVEI